MNSHEEAQGTQRGPQNCAEGANETGKRIPDTGKKENAAFDEGRYIALLYQIRGSWEAGVISREAVRLFLAMSTGAVIEIIKQRQRANDAEELSHREHWEK